MATVDQISRSDLGPGLGGMNEVLDEVKDRVLVQVKKQGWIWFRNNRERVLLTKKIFWFTLSLKVKDLHFIFTELFGPEPVL